MSSELLYVILHRIMKLSLVFFYALVLAFSSTASARPTITGDMIKTMSKMMIARIKKIKAEVKKNENNYMDISEWSENMCCITQMHFLFLCHEQLDSLHVYEG